MSPPTEQLIRDYLNRLSVAARGRLAAEDRKALVLRTRDFIERTANPSGVATSREIAALLSRLGDPATLVGQEVARLTAVRGEAPSVPPARARRLVSVPRRGSRPASWHWPRPAGSAELRARLLGRVTAETPDADHQNSAGQADGWADAGPVPGAAVTGPDPDPAGQRDGIDDEAQAEPPIWIPRQPSSPPYSSAELVGSTDRLDAGAEGSAAPRSTRTGPFPAGSPAAASMTSLGAGGQPAGQAEARPFGELAASLLALARRHPAEAVAVTLLGLGGAAYPPVWLLGVIVALPCKVWDYRDKWVGLAGPVLLLIIGTVAGVSLTTQHGPFGSYVHEAWVYANIFSRVAALAGAGYLGRRVMRGKRAPAIPPWNRPHRIN